MPRNVDDGILRILLKRKSLENRTEFSTVHVIQS